MAQHDYNIANADFPSIRADINNALLAIATNTGGSTAPAVTFANQWWVDETNNLLRIRNETNTGWITVGSLDPSGNLFEPRVRAIQALDGNGLALQTDDNIDRLFIDDTGGVGIGGVASASALLELTSTTRGFRFPRMTTAQRNAIGTPGAGLIVYDTTLAGLYVHDGTSWSPVGGAGASNLTLSAFSAATVVTEAEGLNANDNDSTFPTSAAVKGYVDAAIPSNLISNANLVAGSGFLVLHSRSASAVASRANSGNVSAGVDLQGSFTFARAGTVRITTTLSGSSVQSYGFNIFLNGVSVFTQNSGGAVSTDVTVAVGDRLTMSVGANSTGFGSSGGTMTATVADVFMGFASNPGFFRL